MSNRIMCAIHATAAQRMTQNTRKTTLKRDRRPEELSVTTNLQKDSKSNEKCTEIANKMLYDRTVNCALVLISHQK